MHFFPKRFSPLIGGILIIAGTSLGAGMLALPTMCAQFGTHYSIGYLIFSWLLMTYCTFLLLEANLLLPMGGHIISTAGHTLGRTCQWLTTLVYGLLLMSLLAAYMSGGGELTQYIFESASIDVSDFLAVCIFLSVFGYLILSRMRRIDYVNRLLMFIKFALFIFICVTILLRVSPSTLTHFSDHHFSIDALMVLKTSFGFAIVIPSLRVYFGDNILMLRRAIFIGSLIPLALYMIWTYLISMVVADDFVLQSLAEASKPNKALGELLAIKLAQHEIGFYFYTFASICLITSFVGVGLSLADNIADLLSLKKNGLQKIMLFIMTFGPPLILIFIFNSMFIHALRYAGIFCVILHILIPAAMVWSARKRGLISDYQAIGNPLLWASLILLTLVLVFLALV